MTSQALTILQDIESATFQNAAPLPMKETVQPQWQGLGLVDRGQKRAEKKRVMRAHEFPQKNKESRRALVSCFFENNTEYIFLKLLFI